MLRTTGTIVLGLLLVPIGLAAPAGSGFTYQGQLKDASDPVNGSADLAFSLWDAAVGGSQIGVTVTASDVEVVDGLFTVELDFGLAAFTGNALWVEVDVRTPHDPDDAAPFTTLDPRQPLTATPIALYALDSAGASPWEVNGGNVHYDAGNVGIGTDTPGAPLEVVGGIRSRDGGAGFYMVNPNNPGASAHFSWLNNTARFRVGGSGAGANGGFSFQRVGDQTLMRLTDNRRLGVAEADPLTRLHVTGESNGLTSGALQEDEIVVEARDAVMGLYSTSQGITGSAIALKEVSGGNIVDTWGIVRETSPGGSDLEFTYGPSDNFAANPAIAAITSEGRMGIRISTPAATLDVRENAGFDPAVNIIHGGSGLAIDASQTLGTNACARFSVDAANGSGAALIATTVGTGSAGSFSQSNTDTLSPTVAISSASNNEAQYALRVISNNSGSAANFFCNDTAGTGHGIVTRVRGSGAAAIFQAEGTGTGLVVNQTSIGHIARFQDGAVDQVVIDSQGDLGIGTTSPTTQLDVRDVSTSSNIVNIERTEASVANADMLQIEAHVDADDNTQFIECERGADIEFRVWGDGDVTADGTFSGPADFAEMIHVTDGVDLVEPGDVLVIDPTADRAVRRSTTPRSTLVAGIYSTRPGYLGSENDWDEVASRLLGPDSQNPDEMTAAKPVELGRMIGEVPLAVVGIVPCKVTDENGPIQPGDLLVTSSMPGHAMRDDNPRAGTIVGKSLGSLDHGTGVIRVLVTLQ